MRPLFGHTQQIKTGISTIIINNGGLCCNYIWHYLTNNLVVSSLLQGAGPKLGQFAHVEANGDFRYGTPFLGKNIYRERERGRCMFQRGV